MKQICHITVLNSVRHTRIFFKMALTQIEAGYPVSIIGQGKEDFAMDRGVSLYGAGSFHRLSLRRFLFSFLIVRKARRIGAGIYVLHSPELLPLGKWLKRKTGAKIHYDVHEDYAANILNATYYASWLRKPLAWFIREWRERQSNGWTLFHMQKNVMTTFWRSLTRKDF